MVEEIVGTGAEIPEASSDVEVAVRSQLGAMDISSAGAGGPMEILSSMENIPQKLKPPQKKDQVVFYVDDDGRDPSIYPSKLFEGTFRQGDEESRDSRRNMGIGLSVCMSIIQTHQGDMKAESRKGG
ncbi:MAG: ATP-binding protein [Enterocloster sp.]